MTAVTCSCVSEWPSAQEQYLNSRYQREKKPPPQQLALSLSLSGGSAVDILEYVSNSATMLRIRSCDCAASCVSGLCIPMRGRYGDEEACSPARNAASCIASVVHNTYVRICVHVYVHVCLYIFIHTSHHIRLSIYLAVCLSIFLSPWLSIYLPVNSAYIVATYVYTSLYICRCMQAHRQSLPRHPDLEESRLRAPEDDINIRILIWYILYTGIWYRV